jgi:hypothetical protein
MRIKQFLTGATQQETPDPVPNLPNEFHNIRLLMRHLISETQALINRQFATTTADDILIQNSTHTGELTAFTAELRKLHNDLNTPENSNSMYFLTTGLVNDHDLVIRGIITRRVDALRYDPRIQNEEFTVNYNIIAHTRNDDTTLTRLLRFYELDRYHMYMLNLHVAFVLICHTRHLGLFMENRQYKPLAQYLRDNNIEYRGDTSNRYIIDNATVNRVNWQNLVAVLTHD